MCALQGLGVVTMGELGCYVIIEWLQRELIHPPQHPCLILEKARSSRTIFFQSFIECIVTLVYAVRYKVSFENRHVP